MQTRCRSSERLKQAIGRWWRRYIVDECPETRIERLRLERINNIKIEIALREALRLTALENSNTASAKLMAPN
jgi:hypothetical protein